MTGGLFCGSAAQAPQPAHELHREHEARPRSDPPFAVGLDKEVPAVGAELEAIGGDAADLGAAAGVVEPQLVGREPEDPVRKEPEEGPSGARFHDAHLERRAS